MEVILVRLMFLKPTKSILHVCGGDPIPFNFIKAIKLYSPRMWRWSWRDAKVSIPNEVFSTYVEVILCIFLSGFLINCILHVCGGDPRTGDLFISSLLYSPRMWRWSSSNADNRFLRSVFSTYVEVIPSFTVPDPAQTGILHVCGGDPQALYL